MNIFRLIFDNLRRGTISYQLPHTHECTSNKYRGLIHNDETRCVGCGLCAYVCPTCAIEVTRAGDTYRWTYDPGKCTFCARCVDRCRPNTLSMESELPPLYGAQGELKQVLDMVKKKAAPRPAPPATVVPDTTVADTKANTLPIAAPSPALPAPLPEPEA